MLAQSQQLQQSDQKQKSQIDYSLLKPPRHPQFDQLEQNKTQKQSGQKRYKQDDQQIGKVSLPSLPGARKQQQEIPTFETSIKNQGNLQRYPNRLPKLDAKSEIPKQKHSSNGPTIRSPPKDEQNHPNYSSMTPERRNNHSPERTVLNKRRLMAKGWEGGVFAFKTKPGCLPNKTLKTNQDSAILNNIDQHYGYSFFGVCDGHGSNGHLVSNFIKQVLPSKIQNLNEEYFEQQLQNGDIENCLLTSFDKTNYDLINQDFDTTLSGSTTVTLIIKKDYIWSANVGDSRAIICRYQDRWKAIPLTRDHKPNDEQEKQRIIEQGGRVECQKDFYGNSIGPERVWLQYMDAPGLAMTRSMGDQLGAQAGVISIPEILEYKISSFDKFIVIASDGVWEYLSNEEVMNVLIPYIEKDNVELGADKLVAESIGAWKKYSLARDDITCVVIQLKSQ